MVIRRLQASLTCESLPALQSVTIPSHDQYTVPFSHAYAASADPDTLYHHEAMRELDAPQFMKAMENEFIDQWENGNFSLKKRMDIPEGARILPSVWTMKRKCCC